MQSPPPETYTYPQRVPESTNDVNLKRARVVDSDGKSYIRVLSSGGSSLDSQGVADAMGKEPVSVETYSVSGRLQSMQQSLNSIQGSVGPLGAGVGISDAIGEKSDAPWSGNGNGSVIAVEKGTYDLIDGFQTPVSDIVTYSANIKNGIGNQGDSIWSGSGNGSLIALGKKTAADSNAIAIYASDLRTTTGFASDSAWSGSGNGSLNAIAKRTSNDTHSITDAAGTQGDTAWDGQTANATIIALLKGIYNKL